MRNRFIDNLCKYAENDESIILIVGDLGFNVVEKFQKRFQNNVQQLRRVRERRPVQPKRVKLKSLFQGTVSQHRRDQNDRRWAQQTTIHEQPESG